MGVGWATRAERTNKGCPKCSSSRLTCRLTAAGVIAHFVGGPCKASAAQDRVEGVEKLQFH